MPCSAVLRRWPLALDCGRRGPRQAAAPDRRASSFVAARAYIAELAPEKKLAQPTLDWTPARAVEEMDEGGVATSITSITTPGLWFGEAGAARKLARACNDYAAKLVSDQPRRFGMFVNLPLPDIDGSLMEIAYGLDQLKADGVAMFTSYGDKWLGDPAFAPVFEELNRRKAVVYTHPTSNNCCRNLDPGLNDSVIEYGTDTTRAIARMVFSGASSRYPDLRMIFSHAGGTMPYLIGRLERIAADPPNAAMVPHKGFRFRGLPSASYYDLAQTSQPGRSSRCGTSCRCRTSCSAPVNPFLTAAYHVEELLNAGVFSAQELQAIDRGNAARLMPRYRVI